MEWWRGLIAILLLSHVSFEADAKKFDFTRQWSPGEYDFYFERRILAVDGNRITIDAPIVQDCISLGHASKIAGGRRYSFMINGQLNLVQRCVAAGARHDRNPAQSRAGQPHLGHHKY